MEDGATDFLPRGRTQEGSASLRADAPTPDHWHAPGACMAMASGKHVYLEKPCSHNMHESDLIVNHQKYFNKVVQMGNQQRSSGHTQSIIKKILFNVH